MRAARCCTDVAASVVTVHESAHGSSASSYMIRDRPVDVIC